MSNIRTEKQMNLAFRCKTAEQFKILAGVADKPGQSKYNMGDRPGARTSRRGGGDGGGVSSAGAAGVPLYDTVGTATPAAVGGRSPLGPALPNLFKGFGAPRGSTNSLAESAVCSESFASPELDVSIVSRKSHRETARHRESGRVGESGSSVSVVCACATTITPQALVQAGMSPL